MNEKMLAALNAQINEELYSHYLYLAMGEYCREQKYTGFAAWLKVQAGEEMAHAMKIVGFLHERFGRVVFKGIKEPPVDFKSVQAVFEATAKHEQHITGCIHKLVDLAAELKDHATSNFLAWFVDEQVEEEHNATRILQKLEMMGKHPAGLVMLDHELGQRGK